jgi:hypothetical protein
VTRTSREFGAVARALAEKGVRLGLGSCRNNDLGRDDAVSISLRRARSAPAFAPAMCSRR